MSSASSKSKRSFKSISYNPSSSSNNSSENGTGNQKKKKTSQKTLGMAWGANSRSSSRPTFRNSPFSNFGSYMAVKNQKLHEQFDAAASSSSHSGSCSDKPLFHGVSIFVDGYTVPSSQELRGYMLKHGGRFENYFSRHRVTHIICSNLPDSKIKNLRAFSGGLPVVKPTWVLDCITANKRLSWVPYQLDQVATENDNQPKLSTFFTLKSSGVFETAYSLADGQVMFENDNSPLSREDCSLSEDNACLELTDRIDVGADNILPMTDDEVMAEEPASSVEKSCQTNGLELSCTPPLHGKNYLSNSSACNSSVFLQSGSPDKHSHEASCSKTNFTLNQRHSTLGDPNFVENYFKSSRLHFIGTWRNRYRKRFSNMCMGFREKSSFLNTSPLIRRATIIHVDMDCFFVSVIIRNRPELLDKPVAVCHSDNSHGTAEISSANYPARDHGVKAGMFVKDAKIRCPELVIVPYDFGAYEKVADQFYDILHKHCKKVQAVSCDEAFLDVSESEVDDPEVLASTIRKEIVDTTGCTASAGIAGNMLMARLATKTAKPDGQCYIPSEKVDSYLCTLPVKTLPGIGYVMEEKLKKMQIETCGQLRSMTKESLQRHFGVKTGEMLWNYSRGVDNRLVGVIQESKSIGAEVNWGVRFQNSNDIQDFLTSLCKEVALRLQGCGVQGRSFTLKIKKRRSDAGEPVKYMGCGDCENLSHTITIPTATDDVDVLQRLATRLFGKFHIDVRDIRGVGLQVSKLEGADHGKLVHRRNTILSWLASSTKGKDQSEIGDASHTGILPYSHTGLSDADTCRQSLDEVPDQSCSNAVGSAARADTGSSSYGSGVPQTTTLPPLCELDMAVIESLPRAVLLEINEMYDGKLLGFISEKKSKDISYNTVSCEPSTKSEDKETESLPAHFVESNISILGNKELPHSVDAAPVLPASASSPPSNIMPSSLSQVDRSVLQELPEDLRKDIIEHLPQHRRPEPVRGASGNVINDQAEVGNPESKDELWDGNPPKWVGKFETSSVCLLNKFAMAYYSGPTVCLSSLLQRMIFDIHLSIDVDSTGLNDAVDWIHELLKQYFDLKVETDIEEIYSSICLLRRLAGRSNFFLQVYDAILPQIQASVCEKYGGTLSI